MPSRCKKLQRKRKVDPAKKSAYKKSCLDKKSFGCSDEEYKECLRKYKEKFPPDELDLKICQQECDTSDNKGKCFDQCSKDYPIDNLQKSDPCEGIKEPLDSNIVNDFKEDNGVLIRREFTIKRQLPIYKIGDIVKYKSTESENDIQEGKIINIITGNSQIEYKIKINRDSYITINQDDIIKINNAIRIYEVQSDDKELKIVPESFIGRFGNKDSINDTKEKVYQNNEKVYVYEYGIINIVHKIDNDLEVVIFDKRNIKKSIKKNTVGVDMNDAIPYFKENDIITYNNANYIVYEVTPGYIKGIQLDEYTLDKIIELHKKNNIRQQENRMRRSKIRSSLFGGVVGGDYKLRDHIEYNRVKDDITTTITINLQESFIKKQIFDDTSKEITFKKSDNSEDKLKSSLGIVSLLSKAYRQTKKKIVPLYEYFKEEGKEFIGETLDDLSIATGSKKKNKCELSNKKHIGLFDIDLPYSIKPSFIKGLTLSQKEALYNRVKDDYEREYIKNADIRTLKPFSKKYWAMYNKNTKNNNKVSLKQMNKVHNELIRLKKCGCLKQNAPIDKCTYLNKTLQYFQSKKKKKNIQQTRGGNQYGGEYSSPNTKVLNKLMNSEEKNPEKGNKIQLDSIQENNDLVKSSIPDDNVDEPVFKKTFVEKLSKRLDSKRSDLYKERLMVMKGQVYDGKKGVWSYIKTIPQRLQIFWNLRWGQIITITLIGISFWLYKKNKNLTNLVITLLCTNIFYEIYTGTSNSIFKFVLFTLLSIIILKISQSLIYILGKNSECTTISLEDNINLTAFQNDLYLFSIMGMLLFLISIRGLCNFVPWLSFDWILYKIGFLIYIIQLNVTYNGKDLTSPIGNVAETFFILCSLNALYQYLYFPDKKSNEFKLKNLSYFGDVLQTEYYLSQLPNMKND